mmetsp:Transcript_30357/g.86906  ORF Transcript_30357/g.86906 Transcript_30357/m.86906 type:complete len:176 (+) Transcript_30357:173-700(+)
MLWAKAWYFSRVPSFKLLSLSLVRINCSCFVMFLRSSVFCLRPLMFGGLAAAAALEKTGPVAEELLDGEALPSCTEAACTGTLAAESAAKLGVCAAVLADWKLLLAVPAADNGGTSKTLPAPMCMDDRPKSRPEESFERADEAGEGEADTETTVVSAGTGEDCLALCGDAEASAT